MQRKICQYRNNLIINELKSVNSESKPSRATNKAKLKTNIEIHISVISLEVIENLLIN